MFEVWREKTNKMPQSDVYYQLLSQHVSGIIMPIFRKTRPCVTAYGLLRWFCWMWLVAVVGRCFVGCEHCEGYCSTHSAHTLQRSAPQSLPTTSSRTSTPYAVTHGLCSPEDGHNYARNMLRQKLIINIWLLHLVGFLFLHTLLTMHGHRNLKIMFLPYTDCRCVNSWNVQNCKWGRLKTNEWEKTISSKTPGTGYRRNISGGTVIGLLAGGQMNYWEIPTNRKSRFHNIRLTEGLQPPE